MNIISRILIKVAKPDVLLRWHTKFQMNFYAYNFLKENTFIQLDICSYIFLTSVSCTEILKQRNSLCKLTVFTLFGMNIELLSACRPNEENWMARPKFSPAQLRRKQDKLKMLTNLKQLSRMQNRPKYLLLLELRHMINFWKFFWIIHILVAK